MEIDVSKTFRLHLYVYDPTEDVPRSNEHLPVRMAPDPMAVVTGEGASLSTGIGGVKAHYAPPLRLDRLSQKSVRAAAEFARLVFVLPELPKICWNETHCWLDCFALRLDGIGDPIFRDADDFLEALPLIQEWIDGWAHSFRRTPDSAPSWAIDRGLDDVEVERVASYIVTNLALDTKLAMDFCSAAGRVFALTIPPKATLRLPPTASVSKECEQVRAKEDFALWATAVGQGVLVPAELSSTQLQSLAVDPRALTTLKVTDAATIRPITGRTEETTDDH